MLKIIVRVLGAVLFALGAVSVVLSGIDAAIHPFTPWPAFDSAGSKLVAEYSYFTLWSAIIGTAVAGFYALGHGTRSSAWAKALRLDAAMMLIVTGLVYNLIIADGSPHLGLQAYTNTINHELLPIAMPVLWVLSMPLRTQRDITWPTIGRALIIPTIWVGYCLIRGTMTGFYPYDFLNVTTLGYAVALRNIAGVYALFFVLVAILGLIERVLTSRSYNPTSRRATPIAPAKIPVAH
ncbi:Pr6Pr family membrane protein [Corynebacterium aquilae]|uniref:F420-dependent oxidoreductase n=1 Tax=Corynebacterium aquilae DSM 44791 TaxID=1431546 RepID=A0A1L7CI08_9CORY|nr:Pr6Pr family membrane protein [Corynebacterium aquilae]APT85484.1 hypothetical protein CAQU_10960 [Corynebacterium aquilae DSM 44791]